MERQGCSGHRSVGHWKGYPCGATPKWRTADGRCWCKNHVPMGQGAVPLDRPVPTGVTWANPADHARG
jgi:hypothetical protein